MIRDDLAKFLREKNIGTGVYYPRLIQDYPHLVPFASDCPVAQQVVTEVLSLPVHAGLQISDVIEGEGNFVKLTFALGPISTTGSIF